MSEIQATQLSRHGNLRMSVRFAQLMVVSLVIASLLACTGPAAKSASRQAGATPRDIGRCEDRACFVGLLQYGGEILISRERADGSLEEIYQVRRRQGSTLRSFTHGVLSVATLGIWNVVGVPLEGFVSSADFIVFKVEYDPSGAPRRIEIQGG